MLPTALPIISRHGRTDTVLRLAAAGGARLALSGRSMEPLLREGMVLRLRAYHGRPKIGEVVVFREKEILIAHRIVEILDWGVRTSGDAQPTVVEDVRDRDILAVVDEVLDGEGPDARRIDTPAHRWRGVWFGQTHEYRALFARAREWAVAGVRFAFPWQRPRATAALVETLTAVARGDSEAAAKAAASVPAQRFAEAAERHRCETIVLEAARELLAPVARRDALIALAIRPQTGQLVRALNRANIRFALLKGAARSFRSGGARAHASGDIDVLVPAESLDAAIAALRDAGYSFRSSDALQLRYRRLHHHAAPLFPPTPGPLVELHTQLAPPGTLATRTDWDALSPHLESVECEGDTAYCFDAFASALHYAIHGIGFERFRDIFFCAEYLRELSDGQRAELRGLAESDRIDRIRLSASLALAARVAGLPWKMNARVAGYVAWALRRSDMPSVLRDRSGGVEAWYVAGCGTKFARRVMESDGPSTRQLAGRMLLTPLALAYARAMRP